MTQVWNNERMELKQHCRSCYWISCHWLHYIIWLLLSRAEKQSGYVVHKQAEIHYISYGEGEPVVLLHGGLSNRLSWFSQIPFLVEAGRQVIIIDTRGHGRSSLGQEEISYRLFAEDVINVLDQLKIRQADLLGWSDGGITALILGRYFPERVKKIIAISANTCPSGLTKKSRLQLQTKSNALKRWLQSRWTGAGAYFEQLDQSIRLIWSSPILPETDLSTIKAATLIIVGEKDIVTVDHSCNMVGSLENSQLLVIEGGGHSTPITHANQINDAARSFFTKWK